MSKQIHCRLYELAGPDWQKVTPEQADCVAKSVEDMDLLNSAPNMYGFVGTERIDGAVGGFFALQYRKALMHYSRDKELDLEQTEPFARLFFVLFPKTGKALLQVCKFIDIPLTMPVAAKRFLLALTEALVGCGIGALTNLELDLREAGVEEFIEEFRASERVISLDIRDPSPDRIPEDFHYYNPERFRNQIILDSHRHDYEQIDRINLHAREQGDLKKTHLRDIVEAGQPETMRYVKESRELLLRRVPQPGFHFYVDTDAEEISREKLTEVVDTLRSETRAQIDSPTLPVVGSRSKQSSLFDLFECFGDDE